MPDACGAQRAVLVPKLKSYPGLSEFTRSTILKTLNPLRDREGVVLLKGE